MNTFIDHLNQWGADFLGFAWPMLWQSSLLIMLLLSLDFVFRRHWRASLRYALWLVVLVKLCLPPTLALPTNPVWWLHKTPAVALQAPSRHFAVTYDQDTLSPIPPPVVQPVIPPPTLSAAAWLLMISTTVSVTMFVWLLVRWVQITRRVRRAAVSERLTGLTRETQNQIGLRGPVQAKLTANSMSPAICGLFRPAVLIPQSLAENFSDEQLRSVLLHELIHLRRRDVWVNFGQALLQIVYWWHPLVWLANARLRRVREEAVDDAVMLALRDEADNYAPTLLAVAKLALRRPLVSLGLVGIMESRHALRQRIERLLDARSPRRTELTLVSLLGVLAFTAVAVPMGEAPDRPPDEQNDPLTAPDPTLAMYVNPDVFMRNIRAEAGLVGHAATDSCTNILLDILHSEGVDFGRPGSFKFNAETGRITTQSIPDQLEIFRRVIEQLNLPDGQCALPLDPSSLKRRSVLIEAEFYLMPKSYVGTVIKSQTVVEDLKGHQFTGTFTTEQLAAFKKQMGTAGLHPFMRPRIQTAHGASAEYFVGMQALGTVTNGLSFTCRPYVVTGGVMLAFRAEVQGNGADNDQNLAGTVLSGTAKIADGCHLVTFPMHGPTSDNRCLLLVIGASVLTNTVPQKANQATVSHEFTAAISQASAFGAATNTFWTYRVDTNLFLAEVRKLAGSNASNDAFDINQSLHEIFAAKGVNWQTPAGKSIYYSQRSGTLFMKAPKSDQDIVEETLLKMFRLPPELHIKARFIAVPAGTFTFDKNTFIAKANLPAGVMGILSQKNFPTVLHTLEQQKGVEELGEPEVTVTTGRQCQMRATTLITVITNLVYQSQNTNSPIVPVTSTMETGPAFDVVPWVLDDGYTIALQGRASDIEFLGYAAPPPGALGDYIKQIDRPLPVVLPVISVREAIVNLKVWDNQTIVLRTVEKHYRGFGEHYFLKGKRVNFGEPDNFGLLDPDWAKSVVPGFKLDDKDVIVFITVNIVDPFGNRVHSEEELPFAQDAVPPQ